MTTITLTNATKYPIRSQFAGLPRLSPGQAFEIDSEQLRPIHVALVQAGKLTASPAIDQFFIDNASKMPVFAGVTNADRMLFDPATPGDWDTPPTTVPDALDEIASRLSDPVVAAQQTFTAPPKFAPGADAAGLVAAIFGTSDGEGMEMVVQEEILSPAAIETPLTTVVPKGAIILAVLGNVQSALTGGSTTVTWSLGTTGDPDKYGTAGFPTQADSLAKNSKSNWLGDGFARLTADETIVLTGAATGGAADGDTALTVGSVRVVVIYLQPSPLANA